jgi:hypothetical protein
MNRLSLIAVAVGMLFGVQVAAQDSGLPAPPKPPKSKAAEATPEKGAAQKGTDEKSPSDPAPAAEKGQRGHRLFDGDVPRPRRLVINAPFFHMDLDFGGRGAAREVMPYRESAPAKPVPEGEAVPAPRADEIPASGKRDDQTWRYRFHDGRWWYWLPSERWVYWEDGRWMDAGRPAARRLGAIRDRMGGINLKDLMQSDQIRIGEPRRGNVELELEGLPPLNFGF